MSDSTLQKIAYDPVAVQSLVIQKIEKDSGFEILDPTNSFTMLLEANTSSTVAHSIELLNYERRLFPALAASEMDLFNHMVEYDETNFFASPASVKLTMKVSVESILKYGVTNDPHLFILTIPKNSTITVDNMDMTIMNDIKISLNTQGDKYRTFVENLIEPNSFVFQNTGNVSSAIEVDDKNIPWVVTEIDVLQVTHLEISNIITLGVDFDITIPITDSYYLTRATYNNVNGEVTEIPKVFNDSRFNPDKLSIYVQVLGDKVRYKIPKLYIDKRMISGTVTIDIYTTKGKIQVPLSIYEPTEYSFSISRDTPTVDKAASIKANYNISSKNIINGGVNTRPLREMKNRLIHRATGNNKLPITVKQLSEFSRLYGFTIAKVTDTIMDRLFIATKDNYESQLTVPAPIDVYNSEVTIDYLQAVNTTGIDVNNNLMVIKPGTLFKNVNGIVSPVPDSENVLSTLAPQKLIEYLNNTNILFNPFLCIVNNDITTTTSRVYDIENASMDSVVIDSKNNYLKENVNINGYNIFTTDTGYDIFFRLIGNSAYDAISENVKIQLKLTSAIGNSVSYTSEIDDIKTASRFGDSVTGLHYIHIASDFNINDKDMINLTNGNSITLSNAIEIHTTAELIIYYPDNSIIVAGDVQQNANSYNNENNIVIANENNNPVGMTIEHINIKFADNMNYLWKRAFLTYNDRKYKTYENDVPLLYTKNVYDNANNCGVTIVKDAEGKCTSVEVTPIHAKGDPVLDENGVPVMKHRKGSPIIGEDGLPIFDGKLGVTRTLDILMLEYAYQLSTKRNYQTHLKNTIGLIRDWVLNKMVVINKEVLEHTKVLYMPNKSNVNMVIGDIKTGHIIKPSVRLYLAPHLNSDNISGYEFYNNIGKILYKYFSKKYIVIADLEEAIMKEYVMLDAVKVFNYLDGDPVIINMEGDTKRLTLAKKINLDFEIIYDFNLEII